MPVVGNGSAELHALAVRLKVAGAGGLRLELLRGLKTAAGPLVPVVKDAARNQLPKTGGLNEQVAGQRITVAVRTGARTAGVRLTTTAPDTRQTDDGFVRHPVFGNRAVWVRQDIPAAAGWWSRTLKRESGIRVTVALLAVMRDVGSRINRGL